ncbi:hypothetical protein V2J09_012483 [Rumex salicifolius]
MSDLGSLHYFLGVSVKPLDNGIHLSQEQYALDILARADKSSCNPCRTPVDTNPKLSSNAGEAVADRTEYRSLAGSLQYLCFTRPDICYAVQQCCLHLHDPRGEHLLALKRILRYIKGTSQLGLSITPNSDERLTTYSDADWAGCSIIFGNLTRIFPTYSFHCMCFDLLLLPSAHAPPEVGIGILLFFFFSFDLHWLIWATNLSGLWLTLPISASKCISEEIRSNVIVLVDYYVLGADDLKERDFSVKVHIFTDLSLILYMDVIANLDYDSSCPRKRYLICCGWLERAMLGSYLVVYCQLNMRKKISYISNSREQCEKSGCIQELCFPRTIVLEVEEMGLSLRLSVPLHAFKRERKKEN